MSADGLPGAGFRPANLKELLLFLVMAFAILAPGISSLPPIDRDEPRYETATTQMLASRGFIDIRLQNLPCYLQPAGVYWLQAIPTALFSSPEHRQVWTYRLPSLFGAVLASVVTAWMASLMFGSRIGLSAGVLLAACVSLGFEALDRQDRRRAPCQRGGGPVRPDAHLPRYPGLVAHGGSVLGGAGGRRPSERADHPPGHGAHHDHLDPMGSEGGLAEGAKAAPGACL